MSIQLFIVEGVSRSVGEEVFCIQEVQPLALPVKRTLHSRVGERLLFEAGLS